MVQGNSSLSVSGKWQGRYTYGYSNQLRDFGFELKEGDPGDYAGRMFDDKQSPAGDLSGRFKYPVLNLRRDSSVKNWLRVYEPVEFRGEISDDGRTFSGVWTNSGSRGSWHAERVGAEFGGQYDEDDFAKVAGVSEESPFATEAGSENSADMSDSNPTSIDLPAPLFLRQPTAAPILPGVFNTRAAQSIAPSISVDTISSDSVKSLNIDDRSSNLIDFSNKAPVSFPEADPLPFPVPSLEAPAIQPSAPSSDETICSRCGAPKGGFGFCLSCGHSFGLAQ